MTFKVKPLDNDGITGASPLPRVPATVNIIGSKKTGKSTALMSLLTSRDAWAGQFVHIWYFSPTAYIDPKILKLTEMPILKRRTPFNPDKNHFDERDLCVPKSCMVSNISEMPERLRQIYDSQDPTGKDYADDPWKIDQVCIVLDDLAGTKFIRSGFLDQYIARSRHFKTSFIFSVQLFKSLTPLARNNASYYVAFELWNVAELRRVYEECGGQLSFEEFCVMARDVWQTDHAVLGLNLQNPIKYRYIDNWTHYLVRSTDSR